MAKKMGNYSLSKMNTVFTESSNIISPLGFSTSENFNAVTSQSTGITIVEDHSLSPTPIPLSAIDHTAVAHRFEALNPQKKYTRFEQLAILSINDALQKSSLSINPQKTLLILSTTKGNIDLLDKTLKSNFPDERLNLHTTAKIIGDFFKFAPHPMVVSNACISGVAAIVLAQRLIHQGLYDTVVINGTDILTKFVISGFQSFMSLSAEACKPFDANRTGLTLGEASATLIITKTPQPIALIDGSTSNDANHISGPSRTGEGLLLAINNTLRNNKTPIDFISAHGTATPYNDDMESKAIFRAGLDTVPVNSLKGYFGHTLGSAGVLETIISIEALKQNILINTLGCETVGVAEEIAVIQETKHQELYSLLKLASGFGGGNAAALFLKNE
jgi:3-oxoacyl-[acyl-carrier-protein] synthase-1